VIFILMVIKMIGVAIAAFENRTQVRDHVSMLVRVYT